MQFLYPNVLFFMLIPVIFLIFLIGTNKSKFEQTFNKDIISKLSIKNRYLTKTTRNTLLFIALILMIISLSRPVMNPKEQNITQEVIPLVIAIDVSKSMYAQDIYPSRLEMAKNKIKNIIQNHPNMAVGLTIFAKSSFVLSPLTYDFTSLKFILNNFDYRLNIDDGSNILSVLEAANKLLKDYPNKNVLLLSDGGNKKSYEEEIDYANKNGMNIYTLALATINPTPIPTEEGYLTNKNGEIVTVSLNEAIKELSLKTSAGYINFTLNSSDIDSIISDISTKSSKTKLDSKKYKIYTELFYYPLALALIVLLIAFSSMPKLKNFSFLILTFLILDNKSFASILDFKNIEEATKAYENKDFEKSSNNFKEFIEKNEGKYNFANSLYKEGKYKSALKTYGDIETSNDNLEFKKLHNMGNSYVKLNDLENAKKMYEKALKIKNDKETKENLDLVNKELEKKQNPQNQEQKNDNNNKKENQKQDKNSENKNQQENQQSKQKNENQKQEEQKENKNIKQETISNKEEKKWMELLENEKAPILLRKHKGKEENQNNLVSPW